MWMSYSAKKARRYPDAQQPSLPAAGTWSNSRTTTNKQPQIALINGRLRQNP
ncbi:hypothetical protein PGT21_005067 [Puccinia graminis f. sp. tritici]|uniref:Uncharacterized protein n=1 Tax=Puccinia graminis f. sp. tritici TaxID=56615 RepID=A0A5B0QEI7_PUCGR|nr:hypothetical protein PGT21_005067 [Puccinia graminis f. sp. tritici]